MQKGHGRWPYRWPTVLERHPCSYRLAAEAPGIEVPSFRVLPVSYGGVYAPSFFQPS
jgi:hypothetical protein